MQDPVHCGSRQGLGIGHVGGAKQVLEAVTWLDVMVLQGAGTKDVAAEAEFVVAGWWWNGCGQPDSGGLARLVGELRRWCAIAAAEYATGWDRLSRAGLVRDAERAWDGAVAFDHAWTALARFDFEDVSVPRGYGDGRRVGASADDDGSDDVAGEGVGGGCGGHAVPHWDERAGAGREHRDGLRLQAGMVAGELPDDGAPRPPLTGPRICLAVAVNVGSGR